MFGSATLTILTLLFVVSLLTRQTPLFLLTLALLVAAIMSRVWERHSLDGVEYHRRFSRPHAKFGETIDLEIEIVNRKILPLAWLEVEDEIPRDLPPSRGKMHGSHKPTRAILNSLIALRPYEKVNRHYPLPCLVRGEHLFGPVCLRSGDLFGLASREVLLEEIDTLVVYPRVVPLTALGLPAHQPLGDLRIQSWLFEDPSRMAGLREYRPGDSLRRIDWAATARSQRLQVKVFEPTTSYKLALFLNLRSTPGGWWGLDYDPEALELAIMTAASISAWSLDHGYQVGLSTNGMHRFGHFDIGVSSNTGASQQTRILDALARLQPIAIRPFEETLAGVVRRLAYGSTVVVVSAVLTAPILSELTALRRRGCPVIFVDTGRQSLPVSRDGIVFRRVGPPNDWRELSTLSLESGSRGGKNP